MPRPVKMYSMESEYLRRGDRHRVGQDNRIAARKGCIDPSAKVEVGCAIFRGCRAGG